MVYEYNVHIYISHFFFHKRQGGMSLHIVVTFLCGVGVQKGRVTFYCPDYGLVSLQEQDYSGEPTQGLSVYHLLIIGALDLSRGFVTCVLCCSGYLFEGC